MFEVSEPAAHVGGLADLGEIADLDAATALAVAAEARATADRAEALLLAVAAHYADLHPDPALDDVEDETERLPGMERARVYGGEGCPEVAEFAPVELGAVLGISSYAAAELIGDALGLRHRLPLTWARVVAGEVQAWRARKIATACQPLNPAAAGFVDATVAPVAQSLTSYRLAKVVRAAILHADPALAQAAADRAAADRGVWVGHDDIDGTRTVLVKASDRGRGPVRRRGRPARRLPGPAGRHRRQGPAAGQGDRLAGQPAGRPQPLRRSHHPHPPRPRHRPDHRHRHRHRHRTRRSARRAPTAQGRTQSARRRDDVVPEAGCDTGVVHVDTDTDIDATDSGTDSDADIAVDVAPTGIPTGPARRSHRLPCRIRSLLAPRRLLTTPLIPRPSRPLGPALLGRALGRALGRSRWRRGWPGCATPPATSRRSRSSAAAAARHRVWHAGRLGGRWCMCT